MRAGRAVGAAEEQVARRVLDALWREDHLGIASRSTPAAGPGLPDDGDWREAALPAGRLLVPVAPGGFLGVLTVRRGALGVRPAAGARLVTGLEPVLDLLRPDAAADPAAAAGFAVFAAECRHALSAELAARARPAPPRVRPGPAGALEHDQRAARVGHPAYPTALARPGLRSADLERYAPEHAPRFALRWVALPAERVHVTGPRPSWWPSAHDVGLDPALDGDHALLPVHPLTWRQGLGKALAETGLAATAVPAPRGFARVSPTLSMRTVVVLGDRGAHVKLPLAIATLGALNRRSLRASDLADAAAGARLVAALAAREPAFAGRIAHVDESAAGHAGHEFLAYLLRRLPGDLTSCHVVPVAALAAPGPGGAPVLTALAAATRGGDAVGLFADYLTLLLDWHVTLWLRYGVALEAHQQNVALVLDPGRSGTGGLRLLYRDDDSPRIDPAVLRAATGARADAWLAGFADPRIAAAGPGDLVDMLTTITLHLCAAAPAHALAAAGVAPLPALLGLVRSRLVAAAAPHAGARDAALLAERILDADRLPVKAMLTAGTLLPKSRTGAVDVNKFYARTGPNYLRADRSWSGARAAEASVHNLVNCLLREVCGPAGTVTAGDSHVTLRLPRTGVELRVPLRRRSAAGWHRLAGGVDRRAGGGWACVGSGELAGLVAAELAPPGAAANAEFAGQVAASEAATARALAHRARGGADPLAGYLASEQSLAFGHRHHPAPKARCTADGAPEDAATWRAYAPEAGARFRLHLLAVPAPRAWEQRAGTGPGLRAALAGLDDAARAAGAGPRSMTLPVHPWQAALLSAPGGPLAAADRRGEVEDLGPVGPVVWPTASVRTLYDPVADVFYKTSLGVRITNCVRRNADYELASSIALTRLLGPLAAELADRFDGAALLREPVARTVIGDDGGAGVLAGSLGVIVREGLGGLVAPGSTPLLAAAVAAEEPDGTPAVARLLERGPGAARSATPGAPSADAVLCWWRRYVELLVPPVLHALARGVALEPHLQNVLVAVGPDGLPRQVLLRDLEGVKLVAGSRLHAELPDGLRRHVGYSAERAWSRVAYCLVVNNLGDMAAALADACPEAEAALWDAARDQLAGAAAEPGAPGPLRALLAGAALPAKANLLARVARVADRDARYVAAPAPWGAG